MWKKVPASEFDPVTVDREIKQVGCHKLAVFRERYDSADPQKLTAWKAVVYFAGFKSTRTTLVYSARAFGMRDIYCAKRVAHKLLEVILEA